MHGVWYIGSDLGNSALYWNQCRFQRWKMQQDWEVKGHKNTLLKFKCAQIKDKTVCEKIVTSCDFNKKKSDIDQSKLQFPIPVWEDFPLHVQTESPRANTYCIRDKNHVCGICGRHLPSAESLVQHLQSLSKSNKCGTCSKQFSSNSNGAGGFTDQRVSIPCDQRECYSWMEFC